MLDPLVALDATAQAELLRRGEVLFAASPPKRRYLDEINIRPTRLRVGLLHHDLLLEQPVGTDCVTAVEATGQLLEALGHHVEFAFPPALIGPTGLGPALAIISASGLAARLDAWSARTGRTIGPADVEPQTWARAEQGRTFSAVQVHAAAQRLTAGVMRVPEWWATGYDLLVTPTMQPPPPIIAELTREQQGPIFGLFAMPYSISGQPAISLPLHWNAENLPIGVQIVADYGREDLLIQVAAQLEQAQPWMPRWSAMLETL